MKTTFNLTKIYFKETLVGFFQKSKKSQLGGASFFFVIFAIIAASLGFNYYTLAQAFYPLGLAETIIPYGILMSSIVLLLTSTKSFGENFYKAKDYETLSALPIKNYYIIMAKYLSATMVSVIFVIATLLPAFVVYFIFFKLTFAKFIICLLSLILIPAFSQFIGCIISWISNLISSKMKNKNLISGLLSLIFILALLVSVTMLSSEAMASLVMKDFPLWLKIVMPFVWFLSEAILKSNLLYFLAFVGVSVLYSLAAVIIIAVGYKKINSNFSATLKTKILKPLKYEKHSVFAQMLKKDTKKFFSTPAYFVNVIVGPILALVLPFALVGMAGEISLINPNLLILMVALASPMTIGMAPASAVAISVEGINFKIIKSLPIPHNCFLWSKIVFNILLNLPFLLISQLLSIILLKINFIASILIIVIGLAMLYFISLSSLLFNLLFPKLEWVSVTQVVKQSISVVVSMFVNMIITIIPLILAFTVFPATFNVDLLLLIIFAIILLIDGGLTLFFVKKSKVLYNKLG